MIEYLFIFLVILFYSNHHYYIKKYNDFITLKNTVKEIQKNEILSWFHSIKIVLIKQYELCLQYYFGTRKIHGNTYEVSFYHNGMWYKIPIKINRGPNSSSHHKFYSREEDITYKLIPYIGPNNDFYQLKLRPIDFNISGDVIVRNFDQDRIIKRDEYL
jgi:hypothetical protein